MLIKSFIFGLGMPEKPYVVANDFVDVLKKKHAMGTYKQMVYLYESLIKIYMHGYKDRK